MSGAVGVHPLVVIFALLAATELYGIAGVLVALPLVAVGREVVLFLRERITFESWRGQPIPAGRAGRGRGAGARAAARPRAAAGCY